MEYRWISHYAPPPVNRREILRYMGCKEEEAPLKERLDAALTLAESVLSYRVCAAVYPIAAEDERLDLGFVRLQSRHLKKNLEGCEKIILFAATIGLGLDRLIATQSRLSPADALCLDAIGSERAESLCNAFQEDMRGKAAAEGWLLKPRFSPGFGDVPLSLQKDIFAALNPAREIGLSLRDDLFMVPTKSVTAIIGLYRGEKD